MDRARDEFFAGAALTANEDRHIGVGDALDQVVHLAHLLARAEQFSNDAPRTSLDRLGTGSLRRRLGDILLRQMSRAVHASAAEQGRCHEGTGFALLRKTASRAGIAGEGEPKKEKSSGTPLLMMRPSLLTGNVGARQARLMPHSLILFSSVL